MFQLAKLLCLFSLAISASASVVRRERTTDSLHRRVQAGDVNDYTQVFDGTGTASTARDASIEGAGYITFTTTSSLATCLEFCDDIQACVFVNFYYEFNDPGLPNPVLKCAAYSQVHSASDKTNFGGETLGGNLGPTYIQQSQGWALDIPDDPATPADYELLFGPGINGFTSTELLTGTDYSTYDVQACADFCTSQPANPTYGLCKYFNIFRVSSYGAATRFECDVYAAVPPGPSAVGPAGIIIRFSRGFERTDLS